MLLVVPTNEQAFAEETPMAADPKHLVRTSTLDPGAATTIRHPFNPNSEVRVQRLGDRMGLARLAVSLARVPPGTPTCCRRSSFTFSRARAPR